MQTVSKALPRCKPEEVGIPSKAISAFIDEINEKKLGVQSFTLVRHGKIASQCFWKPYSEDFPHVMYSMSKSVTSTAVGFAVCEGLLNIDDKISRFFPNYKIKGQNEELTVRHLLTMRSDKLITVLAEKGGRDWVKTFFDSPFMAKPDTKFNYISENTHMLSTIVTKVTGQTLVDYLYPRIFEPLGIEKPFWETDGAGVAAGGWGMYMKSEDLAKFFLVYLNNGVYEGKQILDREWIRQATSYQTPTTKDGAIDNVCGYGFQFWQNHIPNSYRADGLLGQRCLIFPEYDALIVINSGQAEDYYIMDAFWRQFPQNFKAAEIDENEQDYQELQEKIANCQVEDLPAKPRNFATEQGIENKVIKCKTNEKVSVISMSITQMLYNKPGKMDELRFNFLEDRLIFTWKEKDQYNSVEAGMNGEYCTSPIRLKDLNYTAFSKAAWQADGSLELWIRPIQTAHVRKLNFRFLPGGNVAISNASEPKFTDMSVYYMSFIGHPVSRNVAKYMRFGVHNLGLPIVEPDFKGKLEK